MPMKDTTHLLVHVSIDAKITIGLNKECLYYYSYLKREYDDDAHTTGMIMMSEFMKSAAVCTFVGLKLFRQVYANTNYQVVCGKYKNFLFRRPSDQG